MRFAYAHSAGESLIASHEFEDLRLTTQALGSNRKSLDRGIRRLTAPRDPGDEARRVTRFVDDP